MMHHSSNESWGFPSVLSNATSAGTSRTFVCPLTPFWQLDFTQTVSWRTQKMHMKGHRNESPQTLSFPWSMIAYSLSRPVHQKTRQDWFPLLCWWHPIVYSPCHLVSWFWWRPWLTSLKKSICGCPKPFYNWVEIKQKLDSLDQNHIDKKSKL